jgi:hypothetical protein
LVYENWHKSLFTYIISERIMSIEEKSAQKSPGTIELADDFIIIQPYKQKSRLRWILPLCIIIIAFVGLWFYYEQSKPLVRVFPDSEEEIERKVIAGIPSFIDNDTLGFSKKTSRGVMLVFEPLSPSGKQVQAGIDNKAELTDPVMSNELSEEQSFAFTLTQNNSSRIYTMPLDTTPKMLAYGDSPSFSDDGKGIVFHGNINNEIWVVNTDGSDRKFLNLKGRRPECSPKRREVVFESNISGKTWNIWIAKLTDTENNLKALTEGKINCQYPSFSPDGKLILFYKEGDGLWVMKKNGSRQQRVLRASKKSVIMMGRISPDGKRLIVWSGSSKSEGKISLYKIKSKVKRSSKKEIDVDKLAQQIESIKESDEYINQL